MPIFTGKSPEAIANAFALARSAYADIGVDVDQALATLGNTALSLHCWQGDDVTGFEIQDQAVDGGGIMATGNYPGRARNGNELRADAEKALALIPGQLRFNLHAIYAETGGQSVERDQLKPEHFQGWMDWSRQQGIKLDFNPTYFGHPLANSGYTLSSADPAVRAYWVRHGIACRRIAEAMGQAQKSPCVINHWIPDGAKDSPADRWGPRQRLVQSLDEILAAPVDPAFCHDAVESKLFGIGSEDYVVGSHEFYMAYGVKRNVMVCFDMGHFHPTETIHDKLSAFLTFQDRLLLHVSRGIRWDSDHVVIFNDDLCRVFQELVRGNALGRANIALDFFDASMNRVGAWVIGCRATLKAILFALLEPVSLVRELTDAGNMAGKLGLLEELKAMPFGAVWDHYCQTRSVPVGTTWLNDLATYDQKVIAARA